MLPTLSSHTKATLHQESEKQLNVTHNISAETNLVLYMPFDSSQARELTPNGSTVLLMHFNNDTGTGENASLFLNNATNSTGAGIGNGTCRLDLNYCPVYNMSNARLGAAGLEFDGLDDFINISKGASIKGKSSATVEAWIKPNKNGLVGYAPYVESTSTSGGIRMSLEFLTTPSVVDFRWRPTDAGGGTTLTSNIALEAGKWYHVAGTVDTSTGKIYINGVLMNSVASGLTNFDNTDPQYIGIGSIDSSSGQLHFNGTIDEVAIWNISLSSGIIAQHSGYGIDRSIYGNNATIMNGSVVNYTNFKFGEAMEFNNVKGTLVNISDS
ncbi:LamG domain-containing protein, partial [Candidatus Woesearchaeota archaeon]|nr:LamG domain-containing protein [Candidatus Woesearchaeota archaeon]